MAQQYFTTHEGVDPQVIARSQANLAKGYKRLIGFECKSGGFDWYGRDPGHQALTAYGLMELTDMAKVHSVDPQLLARLASWLMAKRDGKGGFEAKKHYRWGADAACNDAYITWTLVESGRGKELTREIALLAERAKTAKNSYIVALAANVLAATGDKPAAQALMKRLASLQAENGSVTGGTTTVVRSGGRALTIEVTSLAVLAWLRMEQEFGANILQGIRYLGGNCQGGRFGSTQSTVLALRAILAFDASKSAVAAGGELTVMVDGHPMGKVAFDESAKQALTMPDISEMLSPGKHTIRLVQADGRAMPYTIALRYHRTKPDSAEACAVKVDVELAHAKLAEGEVTEAMVSVRNATSADIPTPIVIVGLPGGAEPRHDQLKELVKAGKIATYEVRGREVILYWRGLAANAELSLPISLVAAVPGRYTGPASRGYLYYTDEHKHWVGGTKLSITPR